MTDVLRQWMQQNGAQVKPSVVAKEMPEMGGGMGLCSETQLPAGTTLASVPLKLMFTSRTARAHPSFGYLYDGTNLAPLQVLPLFLAHESRDAGSFWHMWVSKLPQSYDTLVECPDDVVPQLAACKRRHEKVVQEKSQLQHLYADALEKVQSKLAALPSTGLTADQVARLQETGKISLAEFTKYYCSVMSRGFYYEIDQDRHDVWAMVPWLDYFNYTDSAGHSAGFNKDTQRFEIVTTTKVDAGNQILLHYGTYSNFELLLWYGFVLHSNRNLEYKFSPPADANGMIPSSCTKWVSSIIQSLSSHLDTVPWASASLLAKLSETAVPQLAGRKVLQKWSIAPCRGQHKGVEMSTETPPRLSQDLKDSVRLLVAAAKAEGVKFTSDIPEAEFLKAIVQAELATQWTAPAEPSCSSYAANAIFFMLNEEHALLQKMAVLPLDIWASALQN